MAGPQMSGLHSGVVGVGYEGLSVAQFIEGLRSDGVQILVDARITPRCTRRGFSRHVLAEALRANGIHYVHYEVLGNPEYNQSGFTGSPEAAAAAEKRYRERLATPEAREVLGDLVAVAGRRRVAVMTTEADADSCHRATLLAEIARWSPQPMDIDAVLAEFTPRERVAPPCRDPRNGLEHRIDELLAEFDANTP